MTEPSDTETWRWVENHFKRMGWEPFLAERIPIIDPSKPFHEGIVGHMTTVRVREPSSGAVAFCPVPDADFEKPAKKMAPFIIRTISQAFGVHLKAERELADAVRKTAKALRVSPHKLIESMKEKTFDVEAERFMDQIGGDDG